jgi:hypothetical protein
MLGIYLDPNIPVLFNRIVSLFNFTNMFKSLIYEIFFRTHKYVIFNCKFKVENIS